MSVDSGFITDELLVIADWFRERNHEQYADLCVMRHEGRSPYIPTEMLALVPSEFKVAKALLRRMQLFLGTGNASWLSRYSQVNFFVSRRRMPKKRFRPAVTDWALDSGGFTELQKYGRWNVSAQEYADDIRKYHEKVGRLQWAAPQDWMCEPIVINGGVANGIRFEGTGLSVLEHQGRTIENFIELSLEDLPVPVIPVIQGFTLEEYHHCVDRYELDGIDLTKFETVGVGSICRRQATDEAFEILKTLADRGINIHGFGLKQAAIKRCGSFLTSADSQAWSFNARHEGTSCGRIGSNGSPVKNCANCWHYAKSWYDKTLSLIPFHQPKKAG